MGMGLSSRQLAILTSISGLLFLGRLMNFAMLRFGVGLVLGMVLLLLFLWMIRELQLARAACPKPELRQAAQNSVFLEFGGLALAMFILVIVGGL